MTSQANEPRFTTQTIYLAPDGSPISPAATNGVRPPTTGPAPQRPPTGPSGAPAQPAPPGIWRSSSPVDGQTPSHLRFAPQPYVGPSADPVPNVGLLVWGVVLVIAGLLMLLLSIFGGHAFPTLMVILFAAAGIGFLVMAYVTAQRNGVPTVRRQGAPQPEGEPRV